MDEARSANAPQFELYADGSPPVRAPQVDRVSWRAPGGPVVRWVGIGSCVLLFGLVTVTMLTQPIGATIERLIGPGFALQDEPAAAAEAPDRVPPAMLEPAAGRDEPPATPAAPVLAQTAAEVPAPTSPKVTVLDAGDRPVLRVLPVPSFKPPSAAD